MFAKFSPDGRRVAYVRENNLYVEDLRDGRHHRSSRRDGSPHDHQRHVRLGLRGGVLLPRRLPLEPGRAERRLLAARHLAASRSSRSSTTPTALYPTLTTFPYPKAGETELRVRVGVMSADGGDDRWLDVPGDPRNRLHSRGWTGRRTRARLVLQHLNRLQNTLDVMLADAATGRVRTVLTERDDAWVDVDDDFRWLAEGQALHLDQRARRLAARLHLRASRTARPTPRHAGRRTT